MVAKNSHILYVITKANFGGAQRYVHDLCVAAKADGLAVTVVYGEDGHLGELLRSNAIETIRVPSLGRDVAIVSDLFVFFSLLRIFWKTRPDVVHLNSSKVGAIGAIAGRLARIRRIIFTAHGWASTEDRPDWQKFTISIIHWMTVLLSHVTITVSEHTKKELRRFPFINKKMVTIYNAAAAEHVLTREEARKELTSRMPALSRYDTWIGTGTELHPNKGIDIAIRGFSDIAQRFDSTVMVAIGDGGEREKLEAMRTDLGLNDRVFFAGFLPDAPRYLKAFDIFMLPSRKEGFPYIILEAGSAGVPMIASAVGGIPEAIKDMDTGILIHPNNPQEVTRALSLLLSDKNRRDTFGKKFREDIRTRFSFETMKRETFALYQTKDHPFGVAT